MEARVLSGSDKGKILNMEKGKNRASAIRLCKALLKDLKQEKDMACFNPRARAGRDRIRDIEKNLSYLRNRYAL